MSWSERVKAIEAKALEILIGIDETASAALFEHANDLTISSRAGMAELDARVGRPETAETKALRVIFDVLERLQPGHCFGAILGDIARANITLSELGPYETYIHVNKLEAATA